MVRFCLLGAPAWVSRNFWSERSVQLLDETPEASSATTNGASTGRTPCSHVVQLFDAGAFVNFSGLSRFLSQEPTRRRAEIHFVREEVEDRAAEGAIAKEGAGEVEAGGKNSKSEAEANDARRTPNVSRLVARVNVGLDLESRPNVETRAGLGAGGTSLSAGGVQLTMPRTEIRAGEGTPASPRRGEAGEVTNHVHRLRLLARVFPLQALGERLAPAAAKLCGVTQTWSSWLGSFFDGSREKNALLHDKSAVPLSGLVIHPILPGAHLEYATLDARLSTQRDVCIFMRIDDVSRARLLAIRDTWATETDSLWFYYTGAWTGGGSRSAAESSDQASSAEGAGRGGSSEDGADHHTDASADEADSEEGVEPWRSGVLPSGFANPQVLDVPNFGDSRDLLYFWHQLLMVRHGWLLPLCKWFYWADPETYVNVPALRERMACLDHRKPHYFSVLAGMIDYESGTNFLMHNRDTGFLLSRELASLASYWTGVCLQHIPPMPYTRQAIGYVFLRVEKIQV
eukprot:g11223.t1